MLGRLFFPPARFNNNRHWSHSERHNETEMNADIERIVAATYSGIRAGKATTQSELETLPTSDPPLVKGPPGLKTKLKRHQGIALGRMIQWERESTIRGGILADEMGLGKTLTTLALILANPPAINSSVETTIIVAPANLIPVWKSEIEKHVDLGAISVLYAHSQFEKTQSFKMDKLHWDQVQMYDVVIASYECLQNEWKRKQYFDDNFANGVKVPLPQLPFLSRRSHFYRLIIDEFHHATNQTTQLYKALKALRWDRFQALTGTPLRNRLVELQSVLSLLQIKPFDDLQTFEEKFLTKDNRKRLSTESQLQLARKILSPLIFRRKKVDVCSLQELPRKSIHMVNHQLDDEETMVLQNTVINRSAEADHQGNWTLLHIARMLVCHRSLLSIQDQGTERESCDYLEDEDEWKANFERLKNEWQTSSRLECINAVYHRRMEKRKGNTKVIIFSEWYRLILLIRLRFQRDPQFKGDIVVYHGQLSESDRKDSLRRFEQESPAGSVLLATTGVGAEGITILSAAEVIFASLSWTPATELQASDRVWRLGQRSDVTSTIITCSESVIESHVVNLRRQKYRTMSAILDHDLNAYQREGQGTIHEPAVIEDARTLPDYKCAAIGANLEEIDAKDVWPLFDRSRSKYAVDDRRLFLDEIED